MSIRSKLLATGMILALGTACSGTKTDRPVVTTSDQGQASSPSGTEAARQGKSLVRLVNALPSKQRIDVSGDDRTLFNSIGYKSVTPYVEVRDNLATFRLRAAGTDSAVADNTEAMADGYRYTIVALPDEHGGARLRILRDELVPDSGKARIRVINAAPNVKDADVALQGQKTALFEDVDYAAEAGFKDITPTTANVEIRRDARNGRPIVLKDMHFEAGKAYTIVLTGWRPTDVETITFDDAVTGGNNAVSLTHRP